MEDCTLCGKKDTTVHRLMECGAGEEIWEWTRIWLAAIHRTDWRRIPPGWLLANLLYYLVHNRRTMSLEEYIDFLCRARWKNYQGKKRWETVGNYLEIL